MSKPKYCYSLELRAAKPHRDVIADSYVQADGWLIFYCNPPQGGKDEHCRVRLDAVISMETRKNVF